MATFVMQSLGCEVAALNTVQYSIYLGVLVLSLVFDSVND